MKKIIKIFSIILIILFATNSSAQSMFWPARLVLSLSNTISMQTTADFNSDGILDIVAIDTDPNSGKIYIVFGDLATNYEIIEITNDTLFQNGHQGSNILKIADYNGDGKQDIV